MVSQRKFDPTSKKIREEVGCQIPHRKTLTPNQGENCNGQGKKGYHKGSSWGKKVGQVGNSGWIKLYQEASQDAQGQQGKDL